jgi:hypothetical protein
VRARTEEGGVWFAIRLLLTVGVTFAVIGAVGYVLIAGELRQHQFAGYLKRGTNCERWGSR